jgi:hypothetical protein
VSCLRENLTSSSYGEGLETGQTSTPVPRQPFTRQNRIKEQLSLFADRMSTETLRANQLRLYFSSLVLVEALRRLGLAGTEWAEAQADTIRLKLLKIAAQVRITARRIWVRYSCAYPWQNVFAAAWTALRC